MTTEKKIEVICSNEYMWWREHEKYDIHQFTSDIRLKWEKQERVSILFLLVDIVFEDGVEYTLDETTADILTWYYRFIPRLSGRRRNPEICAKILNFPVRTSTSRPCDRGQPILVWHSFFALR